LSYPTSAQLVAVGETVEEKLDVVESNEYLDVVEPDE
jgi:hypothetical protein